MTKRRKKSKYKCAVINKKRYYFYSIRWLDITGDAAHATVDEFDRFLPCVMITQAYVYKKDKKHFISPFFTEIFKSFKFFSLST